MPQCRYRSIVRYLAVLLAVAVLCLASRPAPAAETERAAAARAMIARIGDATGGFDQSRLALDPAGYLRAVCPPATHPLAAPAGIAAQAAPEAAARAFLQQWRPLLANETPAIDFRAIRSKTRPAGGAAVRFQQTYNGLDVFAAQSIVQVASDGSVTFASADLMRDTRVFDKGKIATQPTITADAARREAVRYMNRRHKTLQFESGPAQLMILDPAVLGIPGEPQLVWQLIVSNTGAPRVRESVFVNAHTGRAAFQYSLLHDARNRMIYDAANVAGADPGALVRSEGQSAVSLAEANKAYDYLGDTYAFYSNYHGRDSLDNAGYTLSATVRYLPDGETAPYENAFWDGSRMYFGDGLAGADDVVAHELTHGVTQNESNLVYSYQSGAINESFSDMWGEWIDQVNGAGNDASNVKWRLGEDLPGSIGVIRNMADPTEFGDPDRMNSANWYTGSGDNGGVHINSGVGNKLCYLLTDGGAFNGYTITGMGIAKVSALFYECQTNLLTSGADYADLYAAATQAAINKSWSQSERDNLRDAFHAVDIFFDGPASFAADSPLGSASVSLSWTNPSHPGFTQMVVRRSTSGYPATPTDGDFAYQGGGTSDSDGPLQIGQRYYYTAWSYYGGDEYSQASRALVVVGEGSPDYFTEQFTYAQADFDMSYKTLTLSPDNSGSFYHAMTTPAASFPTDPSGSATLSLDDDDFIAVNLSGGKQVSLFGQAYSTFYVGSNGYITFGSGDDNYDDSLDAHFDRPRISPLFLDLSPNDAGAVSWKQLSDRAVVTYQNVTEFWVTNSNSFQVEIFFNGAVRITWLQVQATSGISGMSAGEGIPGAFAESNLSAYSALAGFASHQSASISSSGGFFAAVWNYGVSNWGATVNTSSAAELDYLLIPGQWNGIFIYDYASAAYVQGEFAFKETY